MAPDKKVVLFGRTGDGKSTVANALVTGGIERVVFESSDAARGCTAEIQKEKGRGWIVTDTVGIGEADTGTATMSSTEARGVLTTFLKKVKDEYSHIIFVLRANRVTVMDEMNWMLFESIFEGAEDAFVILFTGADEKWLRANEDKLPKYMEGVVKLTVDIPPVSTRKVTESRQTKIRENSIQKLEQDLVRIFEARGNKYSKPSIAAMNDEELEEKSRTLMEYIVEKIKKMFDKKMWLAVASKLSSLVAVAGLILEIISLADGN